MSTFLPAEKGMTIRQPSTANLMLDSADRNPLLFPSANQFSITKNQALLNGFFTRVATTEVVLEWKNGNLSNDLSNNWIDYDISGVVAGSFAGGFSLQGNYTVAEALEAIAEKLSDVSGNWTVAAGAGGAFIEPAANVWLELTGPLAESLGLYTAGALLYGPTPPAFPGVFAAHGAADIRPFRYLDFVSQQLTYNQDLKDGATNVVNRDVLCRWYMAWDQPPPLDALGFPILMGYTPFQLRRIFSPPKQIRWDNIQPLGNLSFTVYTDQNELAPFRNPMVPLLSDTNWLMTLQVSEV